MAVRVCKFEISWLVRVEWDLSQDWDDGGGDGGDDDGDAEGGDDNDQKLPNLQLVGVDWGMSLRIAATSPDRLEYSLSRPASIFYPISISYIFIFLSNARLPSWIFSTACLNVYYSLP